MVRANNPAKFHVNTQDEAPISHHDPSSHKQHFNEHYRYMHRRQCAEARTEAMTIAHSETAGSQQPCCEPKILPSSM